MVKDRFDNIKTTFQRNCNKIKQSMRSGKGLDEIFKPKWDLYPLLTFLKKNCTPAESSSNLDIVNSHKDFDSYEASYEVEFLDDDDYYNTYFDETLQVSIPFVSVKE